MIEAVGVADTTHHERFHRFFSKACWPLDEFSKILLTTLVAQFVSPGQPIRLGGDDTLAKLSDDQCLSSVVGGIIA